MNREHVKDLRHNPTEAEKLLWYRLRANQLNMKFRRQHPMPPYIVDFFCAEEKLIVELDGGQHSEEADRLRSEFLQRSGNKILRFWNNDILENIEGVLETISKERNANR